jgi:Zn-dependent peptidase ImmA (M78 family)
MYTSTPTLNALRRVLPNASLSYRDALAVAEYQANRLVSAWGGGNRAITEDDMTALTRLTIERVMADSYESGQSQYRSGRWHISVNDTDSAERQLFTIAHELKHILDSGCDINRSYRHLTDRQIERICDHFAGCLLMSKRAIYALWGDGLRSPEALARACRVSLYAMNVRLDILGLRSRHQTGSTMTCSRGIQVARTSDTIPPHAPTTARLQGAHA